MSFKHSLQNIVQYTSHKNLPFAENVNGNYQCGFRKTRSTTNQIFTLRQILEKTKEFGIETHNLFIDFKSAYDTIKREQLYNAMSEFNI